MTGGLQLLTSSRVALWPPWAQHTQGTQPYNSSHKLTETKEAYSALSSSCSISLRDRLSLILLCVYHRLSL